MAANNPTSSVPPTGGQSQSPAPNPTNNQNPNPTNNQNLTPSPNQNPSPTPNPNANPASTSASASVPGIPEQLPVNPTPTGNSTQPIPGISSGAAAGIGIGCFILGAGIVALAAFAYIVWRRKKDEDLRRSRGPGTLLKTMRTDSHYDDVEQHQSTQQAPVQLSQFLLDSVPDKDLTFEVRSLGQLIEQHVNNNYHMDRVNASQADLSSILHGLGFPPRTSASSGHSPEVLAALALDPATRKAALRHVLSFVIFSSLDFNSSGEVSMLPKPVMDFVRSIPGSAQGSPNAFTAALSQWRSLSAFLLHPKREERSALPRDAHTEDAQAAAVVTALSEFLVPFAAQKGDQALKNLEEVVVESARLGYMLLSHPRDWRFEHSPGPDARGGQLWTLVVCAGLAKTTRSDGRPYGSPRLVCPPEVLQG